MQNQLLAYHFCFIGNNKLGRYFSFADLFCSFFNFDHFAHKKMAFFSGAQGSLHPRVIFIAHNNLLKNIFTI